jgi:hypothetical protein
LQQTKYITEAMPRFTKTPILSTTIRNSDISVFGGTENIGAVNWDGAAPMDILRIHNTQISDSDNTLLLGAPSCSRIEIGASFLNGGGVSQSPGGEYKLQGTIGQPDAGSSQGGDYNLEG